MSTPSRHFNLTDHIKQVCDALGEVSSQQQQMSINRIQDCFVIKDLQDFKNQKVNRLHQTSERWMASCSSEKHSGECPAWFNIT